MAQGQMTPEERRETAGAPRCPRLRESRFVRSSETAEVHLLFRDSAALIEKLRACAQAHFQSEIVRAQREAWPAASIDAFRTYSLTLVRVVGRRVRMRPPGTMRPRHLGGQTPRLCARLSREFFETTASHPADAARTTAIRLMLQNQGYLKEALLIDLHWESPAANFRAKRATGISTRFPGRSSFKHCRGGRGVDCVSVGILPFDRDTMPIAAAPQ